MNLRHILSLSHFSTSTLKSVFGNLGMLMPAGTKSLAVGKPFRVLLLVASPGLYTACPGWSTLEVLACATRAKCEMLGHARICTSFCCCCTHGRLHCAVARPARLTRTPEPRIAFKLRRYGPRGPSPRHVLFLPFFSFPFRSFYQLVTNHSLCLVSEWDSGWHRAILLALYRLPFQTICRSWGHGLLD